MRVSRRLRARCSCSCYDAAGTRAFVPEPSPTGAARVDELERAANVNADDIVTICWTSGTEGVPKACRAPTTTGSPAACVITTARRFVAAIGC